MIAALVGLSLLAPWAVLASEMPRLYAWPLALMACTHALWLVRQEATALPREVVWPSGGGPVTIDGEETTVLSLQWRGPLVFLQWRDRNGRRHRLSWWPDTLPRAQRRELRLAAQARAATPAAASMAP